MQENTLSEKRNKMTIKVKIKNEKEYEKKISREQT